MKYKSNSRENQDLMALCLLNGKKGGTYLEVGACLPVMDSNTYLLESEFDWFGVSVEWDAKLASDFNNTRLNKCICADATTLDYDALIQRHIKYYKSNHIDFLQLDVDPPSNTFKVLQKIDFSKYSFSFITYEHDCYAGGMAEREESRKIFKNLGYTRFFSDVSHAGANFEDWYVNEKTIGSDNWKLFIYEKVNMNSAHMPPEIRQKMETILHGF